MLGPSALTTKKRDYDYYDIHYELLVWDEDNEKWKSGPNSTHIYGSGYYPHVWNHWLNDREYGKYYPGHDIIIKKANKGTSSCM